MNHGLEWFWLLSVNACCRCVRVSSFTSRAQKCVQDVSIATWESTDRCSIVWAYALLEYLHVYRYTPAANTTFIMRSSGSFCSCTNKIMRKAILCFSIYQVCSFLNMQDSLLHLSTRHWLTSEHLYGHANCA